MQLSQIEYGKFGAAENMAMDAAMLETGHQAGQAMWRVYRWTEPAITFGYSQRWAWVRTRTRDFKGACIRRITGGGIVDHRADLTYALTIPPDHSLFRKPASDIYRELHRNLATALMDQGHLAGLADCREPCSTDNTSPGPGVCFESPEPFDVVHPHSGAKLAGAAMRRSRAGILIQGSLDTRHWTDFSRIRFTGIFGDQLDFWLKAEQVRFTGSLPRDILEKEQRRYGSPEWNRKR